MISFKFHLILLSYCGVIHLLLNMQEKNGDRKKHYQFKHILIKQVHT